jgi:sugar phosphate permease
MGLDLRMPIGLLFSLVGVLLAGYGLFMLTLVYSFNFIDRQILVILQEPIKLEMGLSDAQLGLLSGFSFALVYITAGIPIAYWADRSNRRNLIAGKKCGSNGR